MSCQEALPGDRYLLCAHGLTDVVPHEDIHKALTTCPAPEEAVRRLLDLARTEGAPDDIACVVADAVLLDQ